MASDVLEEKDRAEIPVDEPQSAIPSAGASRHRWAVILAGEDGTRLQSLTLKIAGDSRPKQFCPIIGGETLLSQTRVPVRIRLDGSQLDDQQPLLPGMSIEVTVHLTR